MSWIKKPHPGFPFSRDCIKTRVVLSLPNRFQPWLFASRLAHPTFRPPSFLLLHFSLLPFSAFRILRAFLLRTPSSFLPCVAHESRDQVLASHRPPELFPVQNPVRPLLRPRSLLISRLRPPQPTLSLALSSGSLSFLLADSSLVACRFHRLRRRLLWKKKKKKYFTFAISFCFYSFF